MWVLVLIGYGPDGLTVLGPFKSRQDTMDHYFDGLKKGFYNVDKWQTTQLTLPPGGSIICL